MGDGGSEGVCIERGVRAPGVHLVVGGMDGHGRETTPPNKEPTLQLSPGASELSLSQVFKPLAHLTFARGPALSKLSLRSGPSPDDLRASEYEETLLNLTL